MSHERIITKEYSAEDAGKRVGWISAQEHKENHNAVIVNIATATVGENGASQGYIHSEEYGHLTSSETTRGFLATTTFAAVVLRGEKINSNSQFFRVQDRSDLGGNAFQDGAAGYPDFAPNEDERTWVEGRRELLALLMSSLQATDIAHYYPAIYYLHNLGFAHQVTRDGSFLAQYSPSDYLLADPEMSPTTKREIVGAESLRKQLGLIESLDTRMKSALGVFSDIPPKKIPEVFTQSRKAVARHERKILDTTFDSYSSRAVFIPIGQGRSGRTWPYMDALANTEQAAFGIELTALKAENVAPAEHSLERELKELDGRKIYAQQGAAALRALYQAEQSAKNEHAS